MSDEATSGNGNVRLLAGRRVLDVGDHAGQIGARILCDLGADVLRVAGDAAVSERERYWSIGKRIVSPEDLESARDFLDRVEVVVATARTRARFSSVVGPDALWVTVSPYGDVGPRATWRGSDLTCLAASGNLFVTGDPDRQPIRSLEPLSDAHAGADVAAAAVFALASRTSATVSIQESVTLQNAMAPTSYLADGRRGTRAGIRVGRTDEVWRCADGFVTFGVRGGPSRASSWVALRDVMSAQGVDVGALPSGDARSFDHGTASDAEIADIVGVLREWFARQSKAELARLSLDSGILVAPVLTPREVVAHPQLRHRGDVASVDGVPVLSQPAITRSFAPTNRPGVRDRHVLPRGPGVWSGVNILELGSAYAGPLTSRFFVAHGATCIRVESLRQPDAMRLFGVYPVPAGLRPYEGSAVFASINAGKQSILVDAKHPGGRDVLDRLVVEWADVLIDNYATGVVGRWFDVDRVRERRPDLIHLSSTLFGQDGPHAFEKGYGSQGQALSGHVDLVGWPDRTPVGPYGMVTDMLAPRIGAATIAAALLRREATGEGARIDLAQISAAAYTLGPLLASGASTDGPDGRAGNLRAGYTLHDVFPTAGDDAWIAIVACTAEERSVVEHVVGGGVSAVPSDAEGPDRSPRGWYPQPDDRRLASLTLAWDAGALAEALQHRGIDAYPVCDHAMLHSDPQLQGMDHFVAADHPVLGSSVVEQLGFRLVGVDGDGLAVRAPLLGEHTGAVLDALGLSNEEVASLRESGALT